MSVASTRRADVLVERDRLLEQIEDVVARAAQDGEARMLLIEGQAGIGKSRLAAEARRKRGLELLGICRELGKGARALVPPDDLELYEAHPHRCPPELIKLFKKAEQIADVAARLGVLGGVTSFEEGAGPDLCRAIQLALGLRPGAQVRSA